MLASLTIASCCSDIKIAFMDAPDDNIGRSAAKKRCNMASSNLSKAVVRFRNSGKKKDKKTKQKTQDNTGGGNDDEEEDDGDNDDNKSNN